MKNKLIAMNGSIQGIAEIPAEMQLLYKTVWEIPQKSILELAAGRAKYICQSQSLNIHMEKANYAKISSMHFYGWKLGLKTGFFAFRFLSVFRDVLSALEAGGRSDQVHARYGEDYGRYEKLRE